MLSFLALFSSFVRWLWLCRVRALKLISSVPSADENVRSFDQIDLPCRSDDFGYPPSRFRGHYRWDNSLPSN